MLGAHREILVVENHPDTLRYICKYLRRSGYPVREACDVQSALAEFDRASPPAILLSDIGLPDGDGWELLEELHRRGHKPFAISTSGFGTGSDGTKSRNVGFKHHLVKPFLIADLERLLKEAEM